MRSGALTWVLGVNLVIWTGIFLYLLHLDRKLRKLEKQP
jgi:CcmD family protein